MLGFSQDFQNRTSRISKAWINLTLSDGTLLEYHEDRVMINGIIRDSSTTVDGQFTIGAAVTGKMTVVLNNSDEELSPYDFRDATMIVWLGGTRSDGVQEKVNVGRYYVDEYTYDGSNVTLVGYDDMSKFDIKCIDTNYSWPSTGRTISELVDAAASLAGITVYNSTIPGPAGYLIAEKPAQWDTMNWHDVVAYCAQLMGCFAYIIYVPNPGSYKLAFKWYATSQLTSSQYDGGTFDTATTPYSDGAALDGGSFDPWNTGDAADGGTFGDRTSVHIIPSPYDLTVDTDDVMITGVTVTLSPSDNIEAEDNEEEFTTELDPSKTGTAGYVINIAGNPFVETTSQANALAEYLYTIIGGMRFRPLSASAIENPSMEAGDVAIVTGRNENTYNCFLSRVTYSVNAATQISCDAESAMQNLKGRFSGAQKIQAMVQRVASERAVSNAETAMVGVLTSYASSRGLYQYTETDSSGGTIYTYGNASTLASSDIRWRVSAGSIMVSTDYGQTWNSALSADGTAVMQSLYAVGINADYIEAGNLTLGGLTKNVDGNFFLKDAQGNTRVTMNKTGIFNGKTSINDETNTGFYMSNDGLIIGDGTTRRYARITPDGTVYIHDNPYYSGEGDYVETVPSFIIEGLDSNGNTVRTSISSDEIEMKGDIDTTGNITANEINNHYGLVIASTPSTQIGEVIYYMSAEYSSYGTVSQMYLHVVTPSGAYGVEFNVSDEKLKKDIHDSTVNALEAIKQIKHRAFTWKKTGGTVANGYVAQELEKVLPGSTYDVEQEDGETTKQVRMLGVVPYLSKAIQELSDKVDALEARLAELEGN